MSLDFNKFKAIAQRDLVQAHAQYGDDKVARMKQAVGEPYPPVSSPGDPPHRRTGNLQDGLGSVTMPTPNGVFTTFYVERQDGDPRVPWWLEHGTGRMAPRPFMGPQVIDTRRNGVKDIAAKARQP